MGLSVCGVKGHPVFARFYDFMSRHTDEQVFGEKRQSLLSHASGKILEIGAGSGNNFKYYAVNSEVTAIDPDPHMLKFARKQLTGVSTHINILEAPAEKLPFPNASFDTVVATLVFCTIEDPMNALNEIKRVLKPSGKVLFLEHVKSEHRLRSKLQNIANPLWKHMAGGCHLNRKTIDMFKKAGMQFDELKFEDEMLNGFLPIVWGIARPVTQH